MRKTETKQPIVWIVSSEQWPRALLRAELIENGYDAVGYVNLDQALTALSGRIEGKPVAIVLDLNNQLITGDLLSALEQHATPTIILGGMLEIEDPLIRHFSWAAVLKRPFTIGDVVAVLDRVVRREHQ